MFFFYLPDLHSGTWVLIFIKWILTANVFSSPLFKHTPSDSCMTGIAVYTFTQNEKQPPPRRRVENTESGCQCNSTNSTNRGRWLVYCPFQMYDLTPPQDFFFFFFSNIEYSKKASRKSIQVTDDATRIYSQTDLFIVIADVLSKLDIQTNANWNWKHSR